MFDYKLSDKRVLITGGTSGFGLSAARGLAYHGAKVAINYAGNQARAEAAAEAIRHAGAEPVVLQADVGDPQACGDLVKRAADALGGLDVLVHSAGIAQIDDADPEKFDRVMRVHVHSTHFLCAAAEAHLKLAAGGSIVVLTSIANNTGSPGSYAAAMGAKRVYAAGLARKLAPFNIRVNCVAPGTVFTEMLDPWFKDDPAKKRKRTENDIPLWKQREGWPEADEVGKVILFLASDLSSHVTGEEIRVNGGQFISA